MWNTYQRKKTSSSCPCTWAHRSKSSRTTCTSVVHRTPGLSCRMAACAKAATSNLSPPTNAAREFRPKIEQALQAQGCFLVRRADLFLIINHLPNQLLALPLCAAHSRNMLGLGAAPWRRSHAHTTPSAWLSHLCSSQTCCCCWVPRRSLLGCLPLWPCPVMSPPRRTLQLCSRSTHNTQATLAAAWLLILLDTPQAHQHLLHNLGNELGRFCPSPCCNIMVLRVLRTLDG